MAEHIIANVRDVYEDWLGEMDNRSQWSYEQGRMVVALELVSAVRMIEALGDRVLLALQQEELAAFIEQRLREMALWDDAVVMYERLLRQRRLRFLHDDAFGVGSGVEGRGRPSGRVTPPGGLPPQGSTGG